MVLLRQSIPNARELHDMTMAERLGGWFDMMGGHRLTPELEAELKAIAPRISGSRATTQAREPLAQRIYKNWALLKSIVETRDTSQRSRLAGSRSLRSRGERSYCKHGLGWPPSIVPIMLPGKGIKVLSLHKSSTIPSRMITLSRALS